MLKEKSWPENVEANQKSETNTILLNCLSPEVSSIIQKPDEIFKLDQTFLSNVNCIEEATDQW